MDGKIKSEGCACALFSFETDLSVESFDYGLGDIEPQPGSGSVLLRGRSISLRETFENPRLEVLRYARPIIPDRDANMPIVQANCVDFDIGILRREFCGV